ncbi:unnamed protein product [Ectocarpus sp. 13 AM-2016]
MPPKLYRRAERVPLPFVSSRRLIAAKPMAHILSSPHFLVAPAGFTMWPPSRTIFHPLSFVMYFVPAGVLCVVAGVCAAVVPAVSRASERGRDCWCVGELCVVYTPRVTQFLLRGGCVVHFFCLCFMADFIVQPRRDCCRWCFVSREKKLGVKTSYVVGAEPSWQRCLHVLQLK